MNSRHSLLIGTSALALNAAMAGIIVLLPQQALAACQVVSGDTIISNSSASCLTWNSNNISITSAGTITGAATGISTASAVGNLDNSGLVNGTSLGIYDNAGTIGTITNESGGTISSGGRGITLAGTNVVIGAIINNGVISAVTGINNIDGNGYIGVITNTGTITGSVSGIFNGGNYASIGTIANSGVIFGGATGILNDSDPSGGTIGIITNSGTISGNVAGIENYISNNTINAISNSGTISGDNYGIYNKLGTITAITNNGAGSIIAGIPTMSGATAVAVANNGLIGTLSNSGVISGAVTGIENNSATISATIGTISNSGLVSGNSFGIYNYWGSIGIIDNVSGGTIISSNGGGISSTGSNATIGTIINSGLISGVTAIRNSWANNSIGVITNTGTITGSVSGIFNGGNGTGIGTITNSGTIFGGATGIVNDATGTVGNIIGTITNSGLISGTNAGIENYNFINTIVAISNSGTISGNNYGIYNRTRATITAITNNAGSTISAGNATISSATAVAIANNGLLGTITNSGVITGANSGINNNGTIGAITNSGVISGAVNAIASTGTIQGALSNSGTISGNINVSQDLTITGGNSSTIGTLTGGTITATDLIFDSNAYQRLNDDIVTGTLTNNGTFTLAAGKTASISSLAASTGTFAFEVKAGSTTTNGTNGQIVSSSAVNLTGDTLAVTVAPTSGTILNDSRFEIITGGGAATLPVTTATTTPVLMTTNTPVDNFYYTTGAYAGSSFGGPIGGSSSDVYVIAVQTLTGSSSSLYNTLTTAPALNTIGGILAAAPTRAALDADLQALSPTVDGGAQVSSLNVVTLTHDINNTRMAALRDGDTTSGVAAGATAHGYSMWLEGYGGHANQDAMDGINGYGSNTWGSAIGFDTSSLLDKVIVGVALNYGHSAIDSRNANATATTVGNYGLTFYGTYDMGQGTFVNGQAGYAYNTIASDRYNANLAGATATGNTHSNQYSALLDLGHDYTVCCVDLSDHWETAPVTLTPDISVAYTYMDTQGYTETGAGVADQIVGSNGLSTLPLGIGGTASWKFKGDNDNTLKPALHAGYSYDAIGDKIQTTSSFVGGPGVSFITDGASPARNTFDVGAKLIYSTVANWDFSATYDFQIKQDYTANTGEVRATVHF